MNLSQMSIKCISLVKPSLTNSTLETGLLAALVPQMTRQMSLMLVALAAIYAVVSFTIGPKQP